MNLLMPIETSSRELLYKIHLCNLLADAGFNCFLGTKRNISYLMNHTTGYLYLDKGYHLNVSDILYDTIKKQNGLVVNLDEEGAIDFPDGSTLKNRYTKNLFNASEKIFLWGNFQRNLIKNFAQIDKAVVSGHPRFEMLKKPYHNLYINDINKLKKEYGRFILLNTNFGFGNNIKGDDFIEKNYSSRFKNIKNIIAFDKVKKETYISLVKKLSKFVDDDVSIILRPHPEEEVSEYKEKFSSLGNVQVVFEGSVIPWLLAANMMIHPDCTTSIESLMLGKKAISYIPAKSDVALLTKLPLDVSFRFDSQDKLMDFISEKDNYENTDISHDMEIIEEYFAFSKKSSQIIVNELLQFSSINKKIKGENFSLSKKISLKYSQLKYNLKLKIRNSSSIKLSQNKLSGFDYNNVSVINESIRTINGTHNILLKKITRDLFLFKKIN